MPSIQTPLPGTLPVPDAVLQAGSARRGLSAFFLAGLISAFLGAILPAWRHHIQADFLLVGAYFLFQTAGMLAGGILGNPVLRGRGASAALTLGAALASIGFLVLSFFSPPASYWFRLAGLFLTGLGWGVLQTSVFHVIAPAWRMHPAATVNLGGMLFGLGCLASSLLVASTLFEWSVPTILALLAVAPAIYALLYARDGIPKTTPASHPTSREVFGDFRNPTAILFALLIFFQLGNEGALAGWLALFLTQRLGMSPATALSLLAAYWLALTLGRIAAQWLLPRVSHTRLLVGSVLVPMFGCLILAFTDNLFGAITGVLLAGAGFAMILPLVMEKIGNRFPYFHPGLFNGVFTIGMTGGMLAPASLGILAHHYGIWVVMGLPLLGSAMVFLLLSLLMLEAKLSGITGPAST